MFPEATTNDSADRSLLDVELPCEHRPVPSFVEGPYLANVIRSQYRHSVCFATRASSRIDIRTTRLPSLLHHVVVVDGCWAQEQVSPPRIRHSVDLIRAFGVVPDTRADVACVTNHQPIRRHGAIGNAPRNAMNQQVARASAASANGCVPIATQTTGPYPAVAPFWKGQRQRPMCVGLPRKAHGNGDDVTLRGHRVLSGVSPRVLAHRWGTLLPSNCTVSFEWGTN